MTHWAGTFLVPASEGPGGTQGPFGRIFKILNFFHKPQQYGCCLWTPLKSQQYRLNLKPQGHWGHRGCAEFTSYFFSQYPTIWVSMDSHHPQLSRFDILSWLGTPRTLRVCGGPFIISDTKPHNVKVYGLPWTTAITWEPEQAFNDPKGPEVRVILYWHSTYTYVFTSKKVAGTNQMAVSMHFWPP